MKRLALLGLLLATSTIQAQSCYSTPTYSYRSTTYHAPSYTPSYNYTPSYSYTPSYHTPTYEVKKDYAYFTRLVAFFPVLDVPTYGASVYAPPGVAAVTPQSAANATNSASNDLTKVLEALKIMNKAVELIDARLNRLEGNNGSPQGNQRQPNQPNQQQLPQPQQQQPAASAQQIVTNKCAVCHNPEKAGEWGANFTMVSPEGKLEKLSDKAVKKIVKHTMANTMPPSEKDRTGDYSEKLKTFTGKMPEKLTNEEASMLISYYSGASKEDKEQRLEISSVRPQPRQLVRGK